MPYLFTSWLDYLLSFVPVTIALEVFRADPLLIFVSAGLAIIPLAGLLGRATEHLTTHVGAGIGALLNASLGSAAELIIALVALRAGLHDVVKASLHRLDPRQQLTRTRCLHVCRRDEVRAAEV